MISKLKIFCICIAIALIIVVVCNVVPSALENAEIKRRKEVCEEYLALADIALGFSVEFDITWEKEVYGRDDYEIRNIYPENAEEDDLRTLGQLLDSLQYDTEAKINRSTEGLDVCGDEPMSIDTACQNGGHILMEWSYGGNSCLLTVYDANDKWLAHGGYKVDAEAANELRDLGGLPPIPTIEQVIGRE